MKIITPKDLVGVGNGRLINKKLPEIKPRIPGK
jgi:hypothetical protein